MSLPNDIFDLLRELDIDITDFIETPPYLPWTVRILLCKIMEIRKKEKLYPGYRRRNR